MLMRATVARPLIVDAVVVDVVEMVEMGRLESPIDAPQLCLHHQWILPLLVPNSY